MPRVRNENAHYAGDCSRPSFSEMQERNERFFSHL
jgi:hypothetical protein